MSGMSNSANDAIGRAPEAASARDLPGPKAALTDAAGVIHEPVRGSPRIVSLVPSLTELLCDLGLAAQVVGRTGFCVHPRSVVRAIPKVGGTKSVNLARLRELAPTHVIVNVDENEKPTVDEIARFVPHVIVTHPLAPCDNVALYHLFGAIFRRDAEAVELTNRFEQAWKQAQLETESLPREEVLYLIWKKPWMTVARNTYISATLAAIGWDTIPAAASVRYPEVNLTGSFLERVHHVLLSSEPYRFRERDLAELEAVIPSRVRISLIDGEMTSWYGSRAAAGLTYLADFRRRLLARGEPA
jgi:ABC-type Fe3+-hydroxamate transport system substrate-binding protein